MKKRLLYLAVFYLWLILIFSVARCIFVLCNQGEATVFLTQYLQTIYHGWGLDISITGYLAIIPLLLLITSIFIPTLKFRKWLLPYLGFISFLISLILVADASLYPFWQFKLDASIFTYLDSPSEAMASVSMGYILLRILLINIIGIAIGYPLYRLTPQQFAPVVKKWKSVAFVPIAGMMFVGIRGGIDESTANVGKAYYCDNQFMNHAAVNPCFSLLYSLGKNEDFEQMYRFMSEEERAQIMQGIYDTDTQISDTLLNTTRPNILLIEWEGFGHFLTADNGQKPTGVVAPNFENLKNEGVYFSNYYCNSYRTDRGTICLYSGYLGCPNLSVMKLPNISRTLPSIAQKLKAEGYENTFLYGGDINFTNMKSYLLGTGYQHLQWMDDFSNAERKNPWGVNDDVTFEWLLNHVMQQPASKPWHTAFLTLSSHEPWEVPYQRLPEKQENAFAFTDHCLGEFIAKLKQSPQWDNLLVIITPDHSCRPEGKDLSYNEYFHCPMLWIGGAVKQPKVVEKLMNQSDLAATLLAQMKLPINGFTFSRNVLSGNYENPTIFCCYNDGFMVVDSTGCITYDNTANQIVKEKETANSKDVQLLLEKKGKAILQTLYNDLAERKISFNFAR